MSPPAKFLLAATSFAPIFLTYAIVSAFNGDYLLALPFVCVCAALMFVCDHLLRVAVTELQSRSYRTDTVKPADRDAFNLLLIYLMPLVVRDLSTYSWPAWFLVSGIFCFIAAVSYGYHFNPLLSLMGYHYYKVSQKGSIPHVLICRRRIYVTGEQLQVGLLADYVLIEKRPTG